MLTVRCHGNSISPGGLAEGRLFIGDYILRADGTALQPLSHVDAITHLTRALVLDLDIARDTSGQVHHEFHGRRRESVGRPSTADAAARAAAQHGAVATPSGTAVTAPGTDGTDSGTSDMAADNTDSDHGRVILLHMHVVPWLYRIVGVGSHACTLALVVV